MVGWRIFVTWTFCSRIASCWSIWSTSLTLNGAFLFDFTSTLRSFHDALAVRRKLHGEEHSCTADSYQLIGCTQNELGDFTSALQSAERTLNIKQRLFEEEHPDTPPSWLLPPSWVDPTWVTRSCLSSSICAESAVHKTKAFWRDSIKHSLQLPFTWLDLAWDEKLCLSSSVCTACVSHQTNNFWRGTHKDCRQLSSSWMDAIWVKLFKLSDAVCMACALHSTETTWRRTPRHSWQSAVIQVDGMYVTRIYQCSNSPWGVCVCRRKLKNSRPQVSFAVCRACFNPVTNWANRFIFLLLVLRLLFLQIISTAIFMPYCKCCLPRETYIAAEGLEIFFKVLGERY